MDQPQDHSKLSYHTTPLEEKVQELETALAASRHRYATPPMNILLTSPYSEAALIIENNLLRIHIELLSNQSDEPPLQSEDEVMIYL